MELKTESMKNMKKVVEKCLDELMKKPDLTPAETKAALDGFKLYDELCCRIEDCEMNENQKMEMGYSGRGDPYREYHITSYGLPERAVYSERNVRMPRPMEYAGAPRYGVHGWYQNASSYPMPMNGSYCDDPYYGAEYADRGRGYSRHSISDRAVSCLEQLFDSAASDYEKQELKKYISMVRAAGMND